MPSAAAPRFVTFPDLKARYGVPFSRVHLYRLERAGQFPGRVKLAARSVAWLESEISNWLMERQAARPGVISFEIAKHAKNQGGGEA
jgi:prophage regulatory protein